LRFFFFGFFGLTGACGVRTAAGETPPVRPAGEVLFVPDDGDTPPEPEEELPLDEPLVPLDGAPVPPVAALAVVAAPHASASTSATMASDERNGGPPCMGIGIGPAAAGA
jgi:hypothetical protein